MVRRRRGLPALAVAAMLVVPACGPVVGTIVAETTVTLVGNLVVRVARNEGVQLALRDSAGEALGPAVSNIAAIAGTFALDRISDGIFNDDASFVVIHHLVDDEAVSTVIKIDDTGNLGIKVKGEADVYPFENGRIVFDALPYDEAEITVFNRDSGIDVFAEGRVELPADGQAIDLETGTTFVVPDDRYPPEFADLLFGQEGYATLVNGAEAVARFGVPGSLEMCSSLPDQAWRPRLDPGADQGLSEAWCVRTAEGSLGYIEVADDVLTYRLWVTSR